MECNSRMCFLEWELSSLFSDFRGCESCAVQLGGNQDAVGRH